MKTINEKINFIKHVLDDNNVKYIIPKELMGDVDEEEDLFSIEIVILYKYNHEVAAILDVRVEEHIHVFRRKILDEFCGNNFIKTLLNIENELNKWVGEDE